jgi:ferritin
MISKKLHDAINAQINAELWSAYLYLAMSMDAETKGYKGVANWFYVQFQEEQDHARIFMNYLNSVDAKVTLLPIDEVPATWDNVLAMFKQTLEHEKKVTALINNLAAIANEDRDFASINRLVWFIDEQVEEEENARDMITAVEAVEDNKYGMYMLDKELAARTYSTPSPLATTAE